jgi:hypothetical protein
MACANPQRNVWGGPPDGNYQPTIAANKLAFVPRGKLALGSVIKRDLWEIGYKKDAAAAPQRGGVPSYSQPPPAKKMGIGALGALALIGLGVMLRRKRR